MKITHTDFTKQSRTYSLGGQVGLQGDEQDRSVSSKQAEKATGRKVQRLVVKNRAGGLPRETGVKGQEQEGLIMGREVGNQCGKFLHIAEHNLELNFGAYLQVQTG